MDYLLLDNQIIRIILLSCFVFVPYLSLIVTQSDTVYFVVVGGVIGIISSLGIIYDIAANSRESVMRILLWKSVADLGIALRFTANPGFDQYVCGSTVCYLIPGISLKII
jgi:hypothetical protein